MDSLKVYEKLQRDLDAAYAALREKDRRELDSAISAGWSEADAHYMPQIEQLEKYLQEAYAALREAPEYSDGDIRESIARGATRDELFETVIHDSGNWRAIYSRVIQRAKEAKDGTV